MTEYHANGRYIEQGDALPCPKCGSTDLDFNANVVTCMDCGHEGPDHAKKPDGGYYPEILCDWRDAIVDWNRAALSTEEPKT